MFVNYILSCHAVTSRMGVSFSHTQTHGLEFLDYSTVYRAPLQSETLCSLINTAWICSSTQLLLSPLPLLQVGGLSRLQFDQEVVVCVPPSFNMTSFRMSSGVTQRPLATAATGCRGR